MKAMHTEIISLDHARKERKDRYLSTMDGIWLDIAHYMKPRGYSDIDMREAFLRAEKVIRGGGNIADALYRALKPHLDEPPRAA